MTNTTELLKTFQEMGALLEGHFELTSGSHTSQYVQCARIFDEPEKAEAIVSQLSKMVTIKKIDWVVGPAMGGILLAYEMAKQLRAKCAFTERVDGNMALRRGFQIPPGAHVLIAEDVLTTGGSVLEVARYLEAREVEVVGVAALVNRGDVKLTYPLFTLLQLKMTKEDPTSCSLCERGIPISKPGTPRLAKKIS